MRIPVPPTMGILRCEICRADIGRFDPSRLALPLRADMFEAIGPGFPHPFRFDPRFAASVSWEQASCPVCHKRPFLDRDSVMTPAGKFKVGDLIIPKRPTQEATLAKKNQQAIDSIWTEEGLDIHEEITMRDLLEMYPDKTQDERNQIMIDMQEWEDDETEGVETERSVEADVQGEAVFPQGQKVKRTRRGRKFFRKGEH